MAPQEKKTAGIFDIRNIIGALLTIYGVILTLMGLFADPETEKTGGSNANLVAGLILLLVGSVFIAWARLRPVNVPEHVEPVSTTRPVPRRSAGRQATDRRLGRGWQTRAGERRAVHEVLAAHQGAAAVARGARPAVGVERAVEVAARTVDVDVEGVEARASLAQRLRHDVARVVEDPREGRLGQGRAEPLAVHLRAPQRLVGVDVADPRDEGLVEQGALDRAVAQRHPPHDRRLVVGRLERIGRDVRHRLRYAVGSQRRQRQSPEGALVDEPQLRVSVGEVEAGVAVLLERRVGRLDEHLAAHAEMDDEGVLAVECQPEVLAPARRRGDGDVVEAVGEIAAPAHVATSHPHATDPGAGDVPADDVVVQTPPHDLDLGQLRHAAVSPQRVLARARPRSRSRRTSIACQASLAAFCSASFLLRPLPSPSTSSPKTTRAWNSFS